MLSSLFSLALLFSNVNFASAFLTPAPLSLVQPISNDTSYAPQAPPVVAYSGNGTNTTGKNPDIPIFISSVSNQTLLNSQASCSGPVTSNPSKFWREQVNHNGASPFNSDSTYKVWRNVKDYGAVGDGSTDDSGAFNFAITAWSRNTNSQQTTVPAFIYVPAGTYKISNSIQMLVSTQMVGDALNPPILIADSSLGTKPIIQGYDSTRGRVSTTNFYIAIRNIKLDTTKIDVNTKAIALNWPVSQGCQLANVHFNMPDFSQHVGIDMNGGSTGGGSATLMGDLSFTGGAIGIRLNNQQYGFKNITFNGCHTAIAISHVFTLSALQMNFLSCGTGIDMSGTNVAGSVALIDSTASSVGTVVSTSEGDGGWGSLVLENVQVTKSGDTVKSSGSGTLVSGSITGTWIKGYENSGNYQDGTTVASNRASALLQANGQYFTMAQPQYESYAVDQFVNVKDQGVAGDGATDDTAAINEILLANAGCKITYFPQGTYLVYDTIYVPPGSRIVGEAWSTISGIGSKFWDANNPRPVFQVGKSGETGVAQISDMLFTVADVLNGAIIVEVNMSGENQGDVGFWNSHIRVGGSVDSKVNSNCSGPNASDCKATFLMFHVTPTGAPYVEGMWGWTADHSLDTSTNQVISTGRGALIESTKATWLVGTGFEHNTLYQYNIVNAQNVAIFMQQTETAYWQGNGAPIDAPTPWTVNSAYSDPNFSGCTTQQCKMSWAQRISGGSNIYIYGSGFWVFFNGLTFASGHGYGGSTCEANCCQSSVCQTNAAEIVSGTTGLHWYNTNTHLFTNLIVDGSTKAAASSNSGSWGGVVAAYLAHA